MVTPATRMAAHRNLERLKSRRHRQSMTNGVMDHGRLSLVSWITLLTIGHLLVMRGCSQY